VYPLPLGIELFRVPIHALRAYQRSCSLPQPSERSDMTSFDDENVETGSESEGQGGTEAPSDTDDQDNTDSDSNDTDSDSTDADTDTTDPS
jgi:hypothetical protein